MSSNFWAAKLGVTTTPVAPAAPQTVPAAPQQPQPGPWWANPSYGVPQAAAAPQQVVQPVEVNAYNGTAHGSAAKAQSAKHTGTCPECGSGNYRGGLGQNEMTRCYECGYNPRFTQSGTGGGLPSGTAGPTSPSRQVASGGAGGRSNFQPQNPAAGRIN